MSSSPPVRIFIGNADSEDPVREYTHQYRLIYNTLSPVAKRQLRGDYVTPLEDKEDIPKSNPAISDVEEQVRDWKDCHFANLALFDCRTHIAASSDFNLSL